MIAALVGRSGAGKTWVLERLIPILLQRGLTVAALKHTHHDLWEDRPGSDTERLRRAGAFPVGISGPGGHTWYGLEADWPLADVVLLEGFKARPGLARIEVARGAPPRLSAEQLWATVGEHPLEGVPHYPFDQLEGLAERLGSTRACQVEVDGVPVACPPELHDCLRRLWPGGRVRLVRACPPE